MWAVAGGRGFSNKAVCYTDDEGKTWQKSIFTDSSGNSADEHNVKIFSDYYNSDLFFAIAERENLGLYISRDKGATFREVSKLLLPVVLFPNEMTCFRLSVEWTN